MGSNVKLSLAISAILASYSIEVVEAAAADDTDTSSAPGAVPYTAVALGMRPVRLISQRMPAAPRMVPHTTTPNRSYWWLKVTRMEEVILPAIISPITACAPR
jgi:hypothetical protein